MSGPLPDNSTELINAGGAAVAMWQADCSLNRRIGTSQAACDVAARMMYVFVWQA